MCKFPKYWAVESQNLKGFDWHIKFSFFSTRHSDRYLSQFNFVSLIDCLRNFFKKCNSCIRSKSKCLPVFLMCNVCFWFQLTWENLLWSSASGLYCLCLWPLERKNDKRSSKYLNSFNCLSSTWLKNKLILIVGSGPFFFQKKPSKRRQFLLSKVEKIDLINFDYIRNW